PGLDAVARRFLKPRLDKFAQRRLRVMVVETDVEFRARLSGDHVGGSVADIDRSEFKVRGLELSAAAVERLVAQRHDQSRNIRYWVSGAMRVGDVALDAIDAKRARL